MFVVKYILVSQVKFNKLNDSRGTLARNPLTYI